MPWYVPLLSAAIAGGAALGGVLVSHVLVRRNSRDERAWREFGFVRDAYMDFTSELGVVESALVGGYQQSPESADRGQRTASRLKLIGNADVVTKLPAYVSKLKAVREASKQGSVDGQLSGKWRSTREALMTAMHEHLAELRP